MPPVTELRHTIHQHPELSNREFNTSKLVASYLKSLDLEVRTGIAHTGVNGGIRDNIIPSEVQLSGTVRLLNPRSEDEMEKRFKEILDGTTRAAGGSYSLDYRRNSPVNMNDSTLQLKMLPTMERVTGKNNVRMMQPFMAADDYAYFAQKCPSFFFSLGTTKPGTSSGSLHTANFMGDDGAIEVGIKTISAMVVDFLAMGK